MLSERPSGSGAEPIWPDRPIERLTRPLERFMHVQAAGGLVLLATTLLALGAANSPLAETYRRVWEQPLEVGLGRFTLAYPLWYWINDGLMAVFFFVIGLEIKRELVWGELRDRRNVVLPAAAAAGGVLAPVAAYLLLQPDLPGRAGWAVPMATDIAFVVGCLALLGPRVPAGLKIFLLSLAIIDDILAVLLIAIFFTTSINAAWLAGAAAGFGLTTLLNRLGVRPVTVYVLVGVGIWLCTLKSGVHPTVAGVLLGLLTPASAWLRSATLLEVVQRAVERLRGTDAGSGPDADRSYRCDHGSRTRPSRRRRSRRNREYGPVRRALRTGQKPRSPPSRTAPQVYLSCSPRRSPGAQGPGPSSGRNRSGAWDPRLHPQAGAPRPPFSIPFPPDRRNRHVPGCR